MLIGTLAITGVGIPLTGIGFAGFLSKDAIIESAWGGSAGYAFWVLVIAALFTSFYSWRLMFLTFFGAPRGDHHAHDHAHESPPMTMLIPLGVLAVGAVLAGMVWYAPFFGDHERMTRFFGMPEAMRPPRPARPRRAGARRRSRHDPRRGAAAEARPRRCAAADAAHAADAAAPPDATHDSAAEVQAATPDVAPEGAIFMAPGNDCHRAAHAAPAWVKVSPVHRHADRLCHGLAVLHRAPDMPGRLAAHQRRSTCSC